MRWLSKTYIGITRHTQQISSPIVAIIWAKKLADVKGNNHSPLFIEYNGLSILFLTVCFWASIEKSCVQTELRIQPSDGRFMCQADTVFACGTIIQRIFALKLGCVVSW